MRSVLEKLLPPSILDDPAEAARQLWRSVLTRVNFIPGVRHRLGWRGVRGCADDPEAFTVRVEGMAGVYGLVPVQLHCEQRQAAVELLLCYFPDPDETLLESFSIQAGILAQQPDYLDQIREFSRHEPLRLLFQLGRVSVHFAAAGDGIGLSLEALSQLRIFATDGIWVPTPKGVVEAVPPGGIDQDLPAFATAIPFIRVFAASLSYCLEQPPLALERSSFHGCSTRYDRNGRALLAPWAHTREIRLALGWGAAGEALVVAPGAALSELSWAAPMARPAEYADEPWWHPALPGATHSLDKRSMGIHDKPQLIVLTGFLGAGKTSFLSRFIEYQTSRNRFVAVVQNEIGAKGLDARLLGQNYAVVEMDEGCVCCSLAGNLKLALGEILSSFQPDFIVLETTGVANPVNLLQELHELADQLEFASITTLLDAANAVQTLQRHPVARSQLLLADVVIVNKTDLSTPEQLAALEQAIRAINPTAPVHRASWGDVPPGLLYGVNFRRQLQPPKRPLLHATPGHTHAAEGLASLVLPAPTPLDRSEFLRILQGMHPDLLRAKGIIEFNDLPGPQVFQCVPGFHTIEPAGTAHPGAGFLVVIGYRIGAAVTELRRLLQVSPRNETQPHG